ncbi:MAG: LptF/LptG family permease [Alphaproteobacteria bacterium]
MVARMFGSPTLNRYMLAELVRPLAGSVAVLLALVWLTQSLRFLDLMINKGLSLGTFLYFTLLLVPFLLSFILPIAVFIAACLLFKRLNDEAELPPLFSAGLAGLQILRPLWLAVLLAIVTGYGLSLWAVPASMKAFKDLQTNLRNSEGQVFLEEGTFNQMGDGLMVFLKKRTSRYGMEGLLVHDNRDATNPVTWMAKSGEIIPMLGGTPRLKLVQGIRQDVSPQQVSMLQFKEHTLDLAQSFKLEETRFRERGERTLSELTETEGLPQKYTNQFNAEWHKRLLWPLTPLPFMLMAAAALLQPLVRRRGVMQPLMYGISTMILYQVLLMLAESAATKGNMLILQAQWALPVVFSVVPLWLLREKDMDR